MRGVATAAPRFSWNASQFIVVFREPIKVVLSLQKLAKEWYDISLSKQTCINIWKSYNEHILNMCDDKDWLFLHFDQLFEKDVYDKISSHTNVDDLDESHPKREHIRKYPSEDILECRDIYEKLCNLAGYVS